MLTKRQLNWLLSGLEQIAEETSPSLISHEYEHSIIDGVKVTEALYLRACAGMLASALMAAFKSGAIDIPPVLDRWRELCAQDPLPEVRQSWKSDDNEYLVDG
jgi:hypothetical protein